MGGCPRFLDNLRGKPVVMRPDKAVNVVHAKHLFRSSRIDVCDNINPFGSKMNYLKIMYVGS